MLAALLFVLCNDFIRLMFGRVPVYTVHTVHVTIYVKFINNKNNNIYFQRANYIYM